MYLWIFLLFGWGRGVRAWLLHRTVSLRDWRTLAVAGNLWLNDYNLGTHIKPLKQINWTVFWAPKCIICHSVTLTASWKVQSWAACLLGKCLQYLAVWAENQRLHLDGLGYSWHPVGCRRGCRDDGICDPWTGGGCGHARHRQGRQGTLFLPAGQSLVTEGAVGSWQRCALAFWADHSHALRHDQRLTGLLLSAWAVGKAVWNEGLWPNLKKQSTVSALSRHQQQMVLGFGLKYFHLLNEIVQSFNSSFCQPSGEICLVSRWFGWGLISSLRATVLQSLGLLFIL